MLWDLDREDQIRLFDTASLYTSTKEDFYQTLDIHPDTYNKRRNKETPEHLTLDLAEKLTSVIESEPRYSFEDPFEYVLEEKESYGTERVELEDDFREFLFDRDLWDPIDTETLNEEIGISRASYSNYRNESRSIPKDAYLNLFELYKDRLESEPEVEGDLMTERDAETPFMEDASFEDISAIRKIENLEANRINLGLLKNRYEEDISEIREISNTPHLSTISADGRAQGGSLKALEELNILEEVSNSSGGKYMLKTDDKTLDVLEQRLDDIVPNDGPEKELIDTLREEYHSGNKTTEDRFEDSDELPDPHKYKQEFFSWSNAQWRAGIHTENDVQDREIISEKLLEMTFQNSRVPDATEFYNASDTPAAETVNKKFEDYEELLEETGLKARKTVQKSDDRDYKYFVDDKLGEDEEHSTDFEILF